MYRWIETIKFFDEIPFNLQYHQLRMDRTLSFHGGKKKFILEEFFLKNPCSFKGLTKAKIVYDLFEIKKFSFSPYQFKKIKSFALIENCDIDYSFKSEDRFEFDEMKNNTNTDEIIITRNGFIADTSYSNIIFLKNNEWHTPSTYLLNGTKRQELLHDKKIFEAEISRKNLHQFSYFKLINAMIDLNDSEMYSINKIIAKI